MNQDKIGLFISQLRKEKQMTQQQLGDLLGINGKSVSKWERGINCPDIGILSQIANIFEISVEELLNGERKETLNGKDDERYFKKLLFLTITAIVILLVFLFIKSHYQYNIYHLESNSNLITVDGYIIFNADNEIFLINSLNLQDNINNKTSQLKFILKNDEKELFGYQTNRYIEEKEISSLLKETAINIRKANENDQIDNLVLVILFNNDQIEIPLRISEKLTNNFFK